MALENSDRAHAMCSLTNNTGGTGVVPAFLSAFGVKQSTRVATWTISAITVDGVTGEFNIAVTLPTTLTAGQSIYITGVGGVSVQGVFTVTPVDSTHFLLNGTTGETGYTSGGVVTLLGQDSSHPDVGVFFLAFDEPLAQAGSAIGGSTIGLKTFFNATISADGTYAQVNTSSNGSASDELGWTMLFMRAPFTQGGQ